MVNQTSVPAGGRRTAAVEYAEYCGIRPADKGAGWLMRAGVSDHDRHTVAIRYPDGQTRFRDTIGRRSHRWDAPPPGAVYCIMGLL